MGRSYGPVGQDKDFFKASMGMFVGGARRVSLGTMSYANLMSIQPLLSRFVISLVKKLNIEIQEGVGHWWKMGRIDTDVVKAANRQAYRENDNR